MEQKSAISPISNELDQHIAQLTRINDQARAVLQRNGQNETASNLNQLVSNLARLSRQMARYDADFQNLRALADIGQVVNSSLELNEVLRIVMDTIVRLTGAERGFLMLSEAGASANEGLTMRIARNWEQESLNETEFAISRTVIQRVVVEGQPVVTTNAQEDPRFGGQESIIAHHLRSILCVPLKLKGIITGVIYTDNRIRAGIFSETERDLLMAFANQAAVAIENARLFESVRQTLAEVIDLKSLMDNVFASIASGVITADVEDKIMLCNAAAQRILGHSESEVLGKELASVLPPIAADICQDVATVRMDDCSMVGKEYEFDMPARGNISLSLNLSPLKDGTHTTQGVAIVLDDLTEKKRLEARNRLFGRMVSPKVIEQLDLNNLELGGKRTQITTLFADVRGFTSFSERLNPEQLVSILNQYLAAAADAILDQDGMIDKFMGDAVMGLFNAPLPQPDHALRAVRAAIGIRDAIRALHAKLPPEFHLSFGVGIHYGDAVLGLVGTENKIEYTAIGDSVNTAKRIQENAPANVILMSAYAYHLVADYVAAQQVGPVIAKGKTQPVPVYEVLGLK
ncbi:MAG: adenylate/guanylate cyclase domain-containing protein [Chloroflexota bacterium]